MVGLVFYHHKSHFFFAKKTYLNVSNLFPFPHQDLLQPRKTPLISKLETETPPVEAFGDENFSTLLAAWLGKMVLQRSIG